MMEPISLQQFFEDFESVTNTPNGDIAPFYADVFSFGGDQGVQVVKLVDLLQVLPKRKGFFAAMGLKSTKLVDIQTEPLDSHYAIVRATWLFHYEKDGLEPVDDVGKATYVLFSQNGQHKIVLQIDHQDLAARAKSLGFS